MHLGVNIIKVSAFEVIFIRKMRDDLFVFHGNEATMISTAAHHSCLFCCAVFQFDGNFELEGVGVFAA